METRNIQNIVYLDVLRLVATFGVVALHVCARGFKYSKTLFDFDWYVSTVGNCLVRWAVPMFVMISGVLFLDPDKKLSVNQIFKKNISRLLWAYIFWMLFYAFLNIGMFMVRNGGEYIFKIEHYIPCYHLWFLPMLMGVYIIIPFLKKIVLDQKLMKYALVIWGIYICGSFVLHSLFYTSYFRIDISQISNLFVMNTVIGYTGYFILGYYVSQYRFTPRQCKFIYCLGVFGNIITIVGVITLSNLNTKPNVIFLHELTINVVLMSLALFVFVKERSIYLNKRISSFFIDIRKDLFGVYLIHPFWLIFIDNEIFRNICDDIITIPIIVVVVFMLSLLTVKLIRRIPFLKKVVE